MFFIYGTDAPIYHYPIVTSVMIAINVLIHFVVSVTGVDVTPWILAFGDGFHPLQWVTHNFLHIGWIHLIGNMIFLFPFGLIVEGKIGWWRMLILYMAIAAGQGFSQQAIMLSSDTYDQAKALAEQFSDMDEETKREVISQYRKDLMKEGSGSLGASAVIFGLLAVCAIWAPVNDFDIYFRWSLLISAPDGGERQWSVLTVCGIFFFKEFFMFLLMGMAISSEALHLNGFVVGALIGLVTLYYGFVDCEGFDAISLWTGTKFVSQRVIAQERRERDAASELAKPKGPPPAVVPKMAHQLNPTPAAIPIQALAASAGPPPFSIAPIQPSDTTWLETELPSFDDGTRQIDPVEQATSEIEALVARGNWVTAVRSLAEIRRQHPQALVSAASIGRLAEGLIKDRHIKPAITVLSLGCEAYPAYAAKWRIRIASVELAANQDPIAAIKQLHAINRDELDSVLKRHYLKVAEHAKRMAGQ